MNAYKVFDYYTNKWYDVELERVVFDNKGILQSICVEGKIIPNEENEMTLITRLSCAEAIRYKKDKYGRQIYDGDLLEDKKGNVGRVYYNQCDARFEIEWLCKDNQYRYDTCFSVGEVIGNSRQTESKGFKRFYEREELEMPY